MTRDKWDLIMELAVRGGKEALDLYVAGTAHTAGCITAYAAALRELNALLHGGSTVEELSEAVH
jgi:hypothetical protein